MGRELLLLRHGKSDWRVAVDDLKRPLKDRGKRGAQRMGVWLWQQGLLPDYVVSSPAERALVSAQKCCKSMNLDPAIIRLDERLYHASLEQLLAVLRECPGKTGRVMLVGHNPGLEELLYHLAERPPRVPADGKLMPTAALAQLAMPRDWRDLDAGAGRLLQLKRSDSLPDKFPFPAPAGKELRERPAYYYTQSAVIPYRVRKKKIEVMVVRSSKRKHWVVPKGVAGPGHTLQEAALEEAREEAGVTGSIQGEALGVYKTLKWGAKCTVTVFPMLVDQEIPEAEWEESYRGREWVTVKEALGRLKQAELGPMVELLAEKLR